MKYFDALDVYRPRNPRVSGYYQCVQNHFEELDQVWDERYAPHYRQWVFSLPKRLRTYFMYDRSFLAKLSKCGNQVLISFTPNS
jgi:hypothetical protein